MHALILAGGKGTRLRPLTVYTPKPIVPLVNRPFLLYQLDILSRAGVKDVTLSLSYQPNKIEDLLGDGSEFGVNLSFVTEPAPLGTAGAYKFASGDSKETTIVLNGDILTDVDLGALISKHRESNAIATIALARVPDPSNYGLVATDEAGNVSKFIEKPKEITGETKGVNSINAGIYILEPPVLSMIAPGENASFEYDVFPALLEKNLPFNAHILETEYWRDIGTPENYLAAHLDILSGKLDIGEIEIPDQIETSPTAFIDSSSVLGEGCIVKPNARIARSVLGPGVHVEEKAVIEDSVIWPHCRISTFAEVRGSIVGRGCHVGRNSHLRNGSVIGDKAVIPDYSVA